MAFLERRVDCIGGRLLAYQQQQKHRMRLLEIYNRAPKNYSSTPSLHKNVMRLTKLEKHQDQEHRRNINHLLNFISREKNMSDRLKDPHDFFAYPTYFFRADEKPKKKTKLKKKVPKKQINDPQEDLSEQSEQTRRFGIDLPTVKRLLPVFEQFSQQEIQLFNDCVTRIIMNYNINTLEKVQFLKECVLKTAMPNYPEEFSQLVSQIFDDILISLELKKEEKLH